MSGCHPWTRQTRMAGALVTDPPPGAYRPIMLGIMRAVLPFEHPQFPAVRPADVYAQLTSMFPIDHDSRFLTLQRGLMVFDQVDLFPHRFAALINAEDRQSLDTDWETRSLAAEGRRYDTFLDSCAPQRGTFTELSLTAQRAYFAMWLRSSFVVRRQFGRSVKALLTIAAYTMPALEDVIGYHGPLLEATRAPS